MGLGILSCHRNLKLLFGISNGAREDEVANITEKFTGEFFLNETKHIAPKNSNQKDALVLKRNIVDQIQNEVDNVVAGAVQTRVYTFSLTAMDNF